MGCHHPTLSADSPQIGCQEVEAIVQVTLRGDLLQVGKTVHVCGQKVGHQFTCEQGTGMAEAAGSAPSLGRRMAPCHQGGRNRGLCFYWLKESFPPLCSHMEVQHEGKVYSRDSVCPWNYPPTGICSANIEQVGTMTHSQSDTWPGDKSKACSLRDVKGQCHGCQTKVMPTVTASQWMTGPRKHALFPILALPSVPAHA